MNDLEILIDGIEIPTLNIYLYIYGAGNTARYEMASINELVDRYNVRGFIDGNNNIIGERLNGLTIYPPEHLNDIENAVVIISSYRKSVREEIASVLDRLNIPWCTLDEVMLKLFKESIVAFYEMLYDTKSKKCYYNLLKSRLEGLSEECNEFDEYYSTNMYHELPAFRHLNENHIYVDVGAYVGDSIERFVNAVEGTCKKIVAFEPNPVSFSRLKKRIDRLKGEWGVSIESYPYAVGEDKGLLNLCCESKYVSDGNVSTRKSLDGEEGIEVKQISLDGFLPDEVVTQIKIDTMGAEKGVLLGATNIIRKHIPNIVIATGYSLIDISSIAIMLQEWIPNYKFSLRCHRMNTTRFLYVYQ